jgi:hypothetical protein
MSENPLFVAPLSVNLAPGFLPPTEQSLAHPVGEKHCLCVKNIVYASKKERMREEERG